MIIQQPTLYKRTSTGKIQIWFVEIDEALYRTTSGQKDGKWVVSAWTRAKPKNEGKANATTGSEQAIAEVKAMYDKQIKKDYRYNLLDVDTIERFKPMLATKWADRKDKITGQVAMQPKLDGMRCIANKDGLWSRNGEPILSVPHITRELASVFEKHPNFVFDGELYNHELKDDFDKIMSLCKKKTPSLEELEESASMVQYWVYDLGSSNKGFEDRFCDIQNILYSLGNSIIRVVDTLFGVYPANIDEISTGFIQEGFEGGMIRLPESLYENKRSKSLIKWKEMQDEEFVIHDITEGDGNRANMAGRVIMRLEDGREKVFSSGIIGNMDYCKRLLIDKEKYIGKLGTIVFQNYTPDGIPRFPKFKCVRDYE